MIDVLFGVDLALLPGQVHALLGPNGAGKSTTLKVASAQITPTAGEVWLLGEKVGRRSPDALARAGLCLVPEGRGIFPNLTVVENLRMATFAGAQFKDVLERAFTRFPRLSERRKQLAGTLSGDLPGSPVTGTAARQRLAAAGHTAALISHSR